MKILVAEDDRVTRMRILAFLDEWGHEAIPAEDGEEAWRVFQESDVDLVMTDWLMPGINGLELLKRIRASEKGQFVYTLLLTARSEKRDVVEGIESGADDFVSKPFDRDELRARIAAAQRIVELERALAEQNRKLAAANQVLTAANRRMKESLQSAARIQQSFLPGRLPRTTNAKFAWVFEPCEELAGDTLNIVPLDDDHIGIYIIDVSGHGVPAALLSVHLSRILTRLDGDGSLVRRRSNGGPAYEVSSPAQVTADLNRRFSYDEETEQYFTALYGVLHLSARELCYTSAGHPGPLVVREGRGTRYRARPPAVGFLPEGHFEEQHVRCSEGDRLYFYTDGIFEVRNEQGEEFGEGRLQEVLESAFQGSLEESLERLRMEVRTWSGRANFEDDVSLIGVEIR